MAEPTTEKLVLYSIERLAKWFDDESRESSRRAERFGAEADVIAGDPEKLEEWTNFTDEARFATGYSTGLGRASNELQNLAKALRG
jgi:hypothetical protein